MKRLSCAAILACVCAPAFGQTLQDGLYACSIGSYLLGDMLISGPTYAGPAHEGAFTGEYTFSTDGPTIIWDGPLGGITLAGTVVSTMIWTAADTSHGYDIMVQKPHGEINTVSCTAH